MAQLYPEEIGRLAQYLRSVGLPERLCTELLDHLCCEAEERIDDGFTRALAIEATIAAWPPASLHHLERKARSKPTFSTMFLKLTTLFAVLASGYFLTSPPVEAPKTIQPTPSFQTALAFDTIGPPTASPIPGIDISEHLTSGFGIRLHPLTKKRVHHRGIDLKVPAGTPVQATAAGRVIFAGTDGKYGISVRILHAAGYVTAYTHLRTQFTERGQEISQGTTIGEVGSTGQSIGPHLHYEVLHGDVPIDPLASLELR